MSVQNEHRSFSGELTGTVGDLKVVKFSGDATADDLGHSDAQIALAADPTADHIAGVCEESGVSGDKRKILMDGIVTMIAGAAFDRSAGEVYATYDASGEPIPYVAGSGKQCIGKVVFRNGVDIADGEPVDILLGAVPQGYSASGTATVLAAASSVAVTLPAGLDGKPAFACVMQAADDATGTYVDRTEWDGAGELTINLNAAATANVTVAYFVNA